MTRDAQLSARNVGLLPESVAVPRYDRSRVQAGIVHIGVGGFHRAHQAMYVDRLLNAGRAQAWGICGVGILPADRRMRDVLAAQDGLYTLVGNDPGGSSWLQVIGSIVDYKYGPQDPEAVVEAIAAERTRIVSLTVTEGGYNLDPATRGFDYANEGVLRDLEPGAPPATMFGYLAEGLARRQARGLPGLTVLSCDNMEGNGDAARTSIGAFAAVRSVPLAEWIGESVTFPNSMVDRITPETTAEDRADVARRLGVEDHWPVKCESFAQWVLEDDFAAGRPPLEEAGVQVVADVSAHELMKLRMLNGGHQALGYFGYLAGFRYVPDACRDPQLAAFVSGYMSEARATLPAVQGVDLADYQRSLLDRFGNPHIRDTLARLCLAGSDRIPKFVLPVIHGNLATDGPIDLSVAVVASWARYCEGIDEQGAPIALEDRLEARLTAAARATDPLRFVADRDLFGDLIDNPRFRACYRQTAVELRSSGTRAALERLLRS